MNTNSSLPNYTEPVKRADFIRLLKSSLNAHEYRFARQAALSWLASFPGDLYISLVYAETMIGEKKYTQAISELEKLVAIDPEFVEAQEDLEYAKRFIPDNVPGKNSKHSQKASDGKSIPVKSVPSWQLHYNACQKALEKKNFNEADEMVQKALIANSSSPIPAILHTLVAKAKDNPLVYENLAELYHQRWPECLQFELLLADAYLQTGDESHAVSLLHHCVSKDSAGQVAHRLWASSNPYRSLWPEKMEIAFYLPIPASVCAALGFNQLATGPGNSNEVEGVKNEKSPSQAATEQKDSNQKAETKSEFFTYITNEKPDSHSANPFIPEFEEKEALQNSNSEKQPELIKSIQEEFEKLAKKINQPGISQIDGRYPVYVILSTRKGLENQYGKATAEIIDEQLKKLSSAIHQQKGWNCKLFYADDPSVTTAEKIKPALPTDPWKIKLCICDMDKVLKKQGARIGAVLIVGGPDVVPFHNLPNPIDDSDLAIPSDNPYATSDENYYVPEWPVGRIPGEGGSDATLLLARLKQLTQAYSRKICPEFKKKPFSWVNWKAHHLVGTLVLKINNHNIHLSYGYSAKVWQEASEQVFHSIGKSKALFTCPPQSNTTALNPKFLPVRIGYFNLHGTQDGAEWYGQKVVEDDKSIPDYPVALTPNEIHNKKEAPDVVFSEACYGGLLHGQKVDESIALKFLANGTSAFVGSSTISYGAVSAPLIGADMLAYNFWEQVMTGETVGNALLHAKLNLAHEMSKRQGYLDGEDQKTLLSFNLYGDPLAVLGKRNIGYKPISRSNSHPILKTVTDRKDDSLTTDQLSPIMISEVKSLLNHYLPSFKEAEMAVNVQSCTCQSKATQCGKCDLMVKGPSFKNQKRVVVTLTKTVDHLHGKSTEFARMTLDAHGKVLKLSTSR